MRTWLIGMMIYGMLCGVAGLSAALAQGNLKHPATRKALIRAGQQIERAEAEHRRTLIGIQRALIGELEGAKANALRRQSLDDTNAIPAAIDAAKVEIDRLEGKPVPQTFTIGAAKDWQPTIEVRKGQRVEVRARGTWTASKNSTAFASGPEGIPHPRTREHSYYLEGRLGGQTFPVGPGRSFVAEENGALEMRQQETGSRDDNEGAVTVSIRISE